MLYTLVPARVPKLIYYSCSVVEIDNYDVDSFRTSFGPGLFSNSSQPLDGVLQTATSSWVFSFQQQTGSVNISRLDPYSKEIESLLFQ